MKQNISGKTANANFSFARAEGSHLEIFTDVTSEDAA